MNGRLPPLEPSDSHQAQRPARRQVLAEATDAAEAAYAVGYASPSQFSRDYRRFFGCPPARGIVRLKDSCGYAVGA